MPTATCAQMFSFALRTYLAPGSSRSTLLIRTGWGRPWWGRCIQTCFAARLECLLTDHATAIHFCCNGLKAALLVRRRGIEHHWTTDRLRPVRPGCRLCGLRNVDGCRGHFGRAQSQRQRAALMLDRDAIASFIVRFYDIRLTSLV